MSDAQKKKLAELKWGSYPVRLCRTLRSCEVCGRDITLGMRYRDGGYGRRAHVVCVPDEDL
jgi:hypothetical protein